MLVSVTERTREIGLRKAIGATRFNILMQFLIESVAVSVLGGLSGLRLATTLRRTGIAGELEGADSYRGRFVGIRLCGVYRHLLRAVPCMAGVSTATDRGAPIRVETITMWSRQDGGCRFQNGGLGGLPASRTVVLRVARLPARSTARNSTCRSPETPFQFAENWA